jgi:hypothetical protein
MLNLLKCHFSQLFQEIQEVHMVRRPYEQADWSDIQANLT